MFPILHAAIALVLAPFAGAQLRLPNVISDGMILQQNAEVPIWGWARDRLSDRLLRPGAAGASSRDPASTRKPSSRSSPSPPINLSFPASP